MAPLPLVAGLMIASTAWCISAAADTDKQIGSWHLGEQIGTEPVPTFYIEPKRLGVSAPFGIICSRGHFSLNYMLPEALWTSPVSVEFSLVVAIDAASNQRRLTAKRLVDYDPAVQAELSNADLDALAATKRSLRISVQGQSTWAPEWAVEGTAEALGALASYCGS